MRRYCTGGATGRGAVRSRALVLLIGALAAAGGCGGDDENGSESLGDVLPAFQRAVASGDCAQIGRYVLHDSTRPPALRGRPPAPEECRSLRSVRRLLRGFRPRKRVEFGSAAVVDGAGPGTRRGEVVSTVWVLDGDRWKNVFGGYYQPQVDTKPRRGNDFGRSARAFVEAAKSRRCDELWRFTNPQSRFVLARDGNRDRYCSDVSDAYGRGEGTLPELARDREAEPEKLGETLDFGFYRLDLDSGRQVTLLLATTPVNTPAAARREHESPGLLDFLTVREP
jgi:hypothetical protein